MIVFGVATDVCNAAAIRGLLARGRAVTFVEDASRGLDEARTAACVAEWREAGVRFATADEVDRLRGADVHHLGIAVADLDASIEQYAALFGATRRAPADRRRRRASRPPRCAWAALASSCCARSAPTRRWASSSRSAARACTTSPSQVADLDAELERLRADGVQLIDEAPRIGMFGLQVAFIHPEATGGVLAEFVRDDSN